MSALHAEIFQQHSLTVTISERALAYGDGLFTTAKIASGEVQLLSQHLQRLTDGITLLGIDVSLDGLSERLAILAKDYQLAVLKVLITAGEGGRGYSRQGCSNAKVIITIHPFPEHYLAWQAKGIKVGDAATHIGINPMLAGIKHLNRLEQVLVRKELDKRHEDDLLVSHCLGDIVEASAGNVFWLNKGDNHWYTPDLSAAGVNGLMRQQLLSQIENVQVVKQQTLNAEALISMLVCNSVMGIVPVSHYQGVPLALAPVLALQQILG